MHWPPFAEAVAVLVVVCATWTVPDWKVADAPPPSRSNVPSMLPSLSSVRVMPVTLKPLLLVTL